MARNPRWLSLPRRWSSLYGPYSTRAPCYAHAHRDATSSRGLAPYLGRYGLLSHPVTALGVDEVF